MNWINEEAINHGLSVVIVVGPLAMIGIGITYFCRWWMEASRAVENFKKQVSEQMKGDHETR